MARKGSKYYWWCQIVGWLFWMLLNVVLAFYYKRPMNGDYFLNQAIVIVSAIIITHLFREMVIALKWLQYPLDKMIFRLLISVAVCAAILTFIRGVCNIYLHLDKNENQLFSFGTFIVFSIWVSAWVMIYFLWHYFQKDQQYKLDKLRMESLVKELELRTIKSQINPHFLFNALNSIRALIDENPRRARTAVTELSNILRSSMQA
ncbi:MAG: histidine kinase, partial [Chitinophagaceae bacterium]